MSLTISDEVELHKKLRRAHYDHRLVLSADKRSIIQLFFHAINTNMHFTGFAAHFSQPESTVLNI